MGTFRIEASIASVTGAWSKSGASFLSCIKILSDGITNPTSIQQAFCAGTYFGNGPLAGNYILEATPADTVELDGVGGIHINELPAGFHVTSAQVVMKNGINNGTVGAANISLTNMIVRYDLTALFDDVPSNHGFGPSTFIVSEDNLPDTAIKLFTKHWLVSLTVAATNFAATGCGSLPYTGCSFDLSSFYLQGTYETVSVSGISPNPASPGDTVTLTGDGLTDIDTLTYSVDGNTYAIPDWNGSTFTMPNTGFLGYNGPIVGTLFWGSVSLGSLSVLYANGSGIYRFVLSKRNDTLYDHNGGTDDVAFPRPFGKTGFIGG